jgi:hypothetical protein
MAYKQGICESSAISRGVVSRLRGLSWDIIRHLAKSSHPGARVGKLSHEVRPGGRPGLVDLVTHERIDAWLGMTTYIVLT